MNIDLGKLPVPDLFVSLNNTESHNEPGYCLFTMPMICFNRAGKD